MSPPGLTYFWKYGNLIKHAAVVEQADTRDLKSLGVKPVPVRSRSAAPKEASPSGWLLLVPPGIEPIQMQHAGGMLLAAGLEAAPNQYDPNRIFLVGNGFGLFVYFQIENISKNYAGRIGLPPARRLKWTMYYCIFGSSQYV